MSEEMSYIRRVVKEATPEPDDAPGEEGEDEEKGTHPMNPEAREAAAELADALDDDCDAEEIIDAVQNRRQAEDYEDEETVMEDG